ncbi:hypothetical protein LR48_Vigan01g106600, partial [Vigna angularis]
LLREKEDAGKENQQLSRQLDEITQGDKIIFPISITLLSVFIFVSKLLLLLEFLVKISWCILGKSSTPDTTSEQVMKEEKDTRIQVHLKL